VRKYERLFNEFEQWQTEPGSDYLLGNIKEIKMDLRPIDFGIGPGSDKDLLKVIERCAKFCGQTVERWEGKFTREIDKERMAVAFGKFEKLKILVLENIKQEDEVTSVLAIAEACLNLEQVILTGGKGSRTQSGTSPRRVSLRITRDRERSQPRIVSIEELDYEDVLG
jgi:hypothetical protein